jgi:hypothetical protein
MTNEEFTLEFPERLHVIQSRVFLPKAYEDTCCGIASIGITAFPLLSV